MIFLLESSLNKQKNEENKKGYLACVASLKGSGRIKHKEINDK